MKKQIEFLNQPIPTTKLCPIPFESHMTLLDQQQAQLRCIAEQWLEKKCSKLQSMQTVEQNYIINCMFISIYKAACEYMTQQMAEEFTCALSTELKPKLIKLLEK